MVAEHSKIDGREPIRRLYRLSFVKNCHRLLALAYNRLESSSLRDLQEPAITGILAKGMNCLAESEAAPAWMRYLIVLDDPPQDSAGRLGKERRRVDIEFRLVRRGPRPRFHFEAKRLYRSDSVAEYLGAGGLELFVVGEYASDKDAGGMLGYVQTDPLEKWVARIGGSLGAARDKLAVCEATGFALVALVAELNFVYFTCHERASVGRRIHIYHTFLRCC
jgi:hypothetical protein